jgi:hypothetical protein
MPRQVPAVTACKLHFPDSRSKATRWRNCTEKTANSQMVNLSPENVHTALGSSPARRRGGILMYFRQDARGQNVSDEACHHRTVSKCGCPKIVAINVEDNHDFRSKYDSEHTKYVARN